MANYAAYIPAVGAIDYPTQISNFITISEAIDTEVENARDGEANLLANLNTKAPLASPTFTGTVVLPSTTSIGTTSNIELGYVDGVTSAIQTQIDLKSPLASPTFTGTVVLPSTTSIGTTSNIELGYVDGVTSAIQTQMDLKSPLASPTFTGTPSLPTGTTGVTQTAGNSTTALATTAFVTTADNLKANLASPTFTGTPSLPTGTTAITQTAADNSTQIATTAYADNILSLVYPVGSIYTNANVSTNPGTLLGFGTWVTFGAGRVPVGLDSGDADFDTGEETGGSKTHTLTEAEMPAHTHDMTSDGVPQGSSGTGADRNSGSSRSSPTDSTGGGTAHTIVQPYIVVYMWKRTI